MTTYLIMLGAFFGSGLAMIAAGVLRPASTLQTELDSYDPAKLLTGGRRPVAEDPRPARLVGLGKRLESLTLIKGATRRDQDLAVTKDTAEHFAVATATASLAGLLMPALLIVMLDGLGIRMPLPEGLAVCLAGAAGGTIAPAIALKRSAGESRQTWLHSFSCWLELVALAQAGGMGIESALYAASRISGDETFLRMQASLDHARHTGASPWEEIGRLADELGIDELAELAASLGLAGMEGARIRSSLQAKSASLRRRELAESLARANATTERLFLPSIVLMMGFLIFIMYPAGVSLSHVL